MKNLLVLSLASTFALSGCITVERHAPRTVVVEPAVTSVRTVRVLPRGYVTRTYRGNDYYYYGNTYYRTYPRGGYVVVDRPW